MKLPHGLHLAYCTNIHRGESWAETLDNLQRHTLAVRERVAPDEPYAIGLRLGVLAAKELSDPSALLAFQRWLERHQCYVFTFNGFPYGKFHGARVKEQVYAPDWTAPERLEYTCLLFDILSQLVPLGVEGSVSTVPVSFKEFMKEARQEAVARGHLWACVERLEKLTRRTGKTLHLGLEPEPLCHLETTPETVAFFDRMRADRPGDLRLAEHLGVNYDCCHLAVEFETASVSLSKLRECGIRLSKVHLSSALRLHPDPQARHALHAFAEDTYFHQVVARDDHGKITRFRDLPDALALHNHLPPSLSEEWRIHFHVPLHATPASPLLTTSEHVTQTLDWLKANTGACSHLEMETYTWEVMPGEMKNRSVVDQLVGEYQWCLHELARRGLAAPRFLRSETSR
ncbi:MAG: metabolite traffic protein EboE [Verrucomicrobia bacterium]|nr:metabolite traffic protein EboE [Verrucomicrobiota bacterium]MBI3867648.1 metabolite traffic protein EboE [Verrucomicrobiota bacterium]